jgi:hypothetical protein
VPALVLTADALQMPAPSGEALRAAGVPYPKSATYRVCVGREGRVASAEPLQPAPEAAAVGDHLRAAWAFRPQPLRTCAVLTLQLDPR